MKLTIKSTGITTRIDDVPVRLWDGVTPQGVRCKVFVHRVAVDERDDCVQFDRELREQLVPAELMEFVPLRNLL